MCCLTKVKWTSDTHPIAQNVVLQATRIVQPEALLVILVRKKQTIVLSYKRETGCHIYVTHNQIVAHTV